MTLPASFANALSALATFALLSLSGAPAAAQKSATVALQKAAVPAAPPAAPVATSMLRIACIDDNVNAEISINGKFRGECPMDMPLAEGEVRLRATKRVDEERERVYQRTFRIGEGVVKREEIELGAPQLTAAAQRLADERQRAEEQRLQAERDAREKVERERQAAEEKATASAQEAIASLMRRAEAGEPAAMTEVGRIYEIGDVFTPNLHLSVQWYQKAALAGDAQAMYRLAWKYETGTGTVKDIAQARSWYQKSAEAGNAGGMGGMAAFHFQGQMAGGTSDPVGTQIWLDKALAAGDTPRAMALRGVLLNESKDPEQRRLGLAWIERAAEAGSQTAMRVLAQLLLAQDRADPRTVRWLLRATEMQPDGSPGYGPAMSLLGRCYALGWGGLPANMLIAVSWYHKALDRGDTSVVQALAEAYNNGGPGMAPDPIKGMAFGFMAQALRAKAAAAANTR